MSTRTRPLKTTAVAATFVLLAAGCGSDTSNLEVGECVHVEAADFAIGGDVDSASCDDVGVLSDNYRVVDTGSESEMESVCAPPDLIIVDGDDAACLTQ